MIYYINMSHNKVPSIQIITEYTSFFKLLRDAVNSEDEFDNSNDEDYTCYYPLEVSREQIPDIYLNNEEKFWNYIQKLSWRDKSEAKCSDNNLMNLTRNDLNFVVHNIDIYASALLDVMNSDIMIDFNEEKKKNILYHIIGKGSQFYHACIIDPEFCSYIIGENEFYPLYSYMKPYIK